MKIKNSKDFWSGVMFIGTGLFFMLWAIFNYQMGTAVRMGPAYFPTVLGFLLAGTGVVECQTRGEYVVDGGLVPVSVRGDSALYVEPNVWMRHPV